MGATAEQVRQWRFCYTLGEGMHIQQLREPLVGKTLCDEIVVSSEWPDKKKGVRVCDTCMAVLEDMYRAAGVIFTKEDAVATYAGNR